MSYYPEFAELLNKYLKVEDRTLTWLAKRLGMAPGTVSRWLNHGKRPGSTETVIRIADILGIHDRSERQELLFAAGYGYLEREHSPSSDTTASSAEKTRRRPPPPAPPPILGEGSSSPPPAPPPILGEGSSSPPLALGEGLGVGAGHEVGAVSVQTWQYYAGGIVYAVSVSEDGQIVVAGSSLKTVFCLNEAGKEQWQKKVGNEGWRTALSADGQIMVVGTGSTRFWDQGRLGLFCFAKDGSLRWRQELGYSVRGLSISADGSTIAVGTTGNQLLLFDSQGNRLWNRDVPAIAWYGWVWSTALSSDGTLIIAGSADKHIRLLDRSARLLAEHQARGEVSTVAASANGIAAAAGDGKRFIYFFNQHGKFLWEKELPHKVWDMKLRHDGQQLFVGSAEKHGHLTVYDHTGQLLWQRFVESGVSCLDVNADGQRIAVGSYEGGIYIFDGAGNLEHQAQAGKQIHDIALSASGETVIAGSEDGFVYGFILPRLVTSDQ